MTKGVKKKSIYNSGAIAHEVKISAKSLNVIVSPKNFTVGSAVTSDQSSLQIFCLGNVFKTEVTVDPTKNHSI